MEKANSLAYDNIEALASALLRIWQSLLSWNASYEAAIAVAAGWNYQFVRGT